MISPIALTVCLASFAAPQKSAPQAPPPPRVANLGLQTAAFAANDHFVAFLVNEIGNHDLNGDGDSLDRVAFIHRPRTGETLNLGLAAATLEQTGQRAVFLVSERDQAGSDLNGDGDANDAVLALYDDADGSLAVFDQATFTYRLGERLLLFEVNETSQGQSDLNGDGDTGDHVVFVRDLQAGVDWNTGLAGFPNANTGLRLEGRRAAFIVPELLQGEDLNGDGDTNDPVLHVVDARRGTITNLGLAFAGPFEWSFGHLAFSVRESSQSADLNGDGDLSDSVLHVLRPGAAQADNQGIAVADLKAGPGYFVYREFERQQGEDFNGDGDLLDGTLSVQTLHPRRKYRTGLDALIGYEPAKGFVGFEVSESQQGGLDQNGDGDALDAIAHVFDVRRGVARSLETTSTGLSMGSRHVLVRVSEEGAGGVDLDGDGVIEDQVVVFVDPRSGARRSSGLSTVPSFVDPVVAENQRRAVIYVSEAATGADLNGDGDQSDAVPHFVEPGQERAGNLGTSGWGIPDGGFVLTRGFLAFLVLESSEGRDLNGDGDLFDRVLHIAR